MTYGEFGKTWTAKHYSGAYGVLGAKSIVMLFEKFEKRGTKWKIVSWEIEDILPENYVYTIDATPFFRNLGGHERITCSYTPYGYMPTKVSSISPDRTQKVVRTFTLT